MRLALARTLLAQPSSSSRPDPAARGYLRHQSSCLRLHSRPPRQRLPSSLVIESASAFASRPSSPSRAEALPMNASDQAGLIGPLDAIWADEEYAGRSNPPSPD